MKRSVFSNGQRTSHSQHLQGLVKNTSIHAGIRSPLLRKRGDLKNDKRCGFEIIKARDLDTLGMEGVIDRIKERVGDSLVYISVDIDVLDPAYAPGKLEFSLRYPEMSKKQY
jgi:agmatinase